MQTAKDDTESQDTIQAIGWVLDSPNIAPEVSEFSSREEWAKAVARAEAEFREAFRAKFGTPEEPTHPPCRCVPDPAPSHVRVLPANPWGWTNLVR